MATNYGWIIKDQNEDPTFVPEYTDFITRENVSTAERPKLVVKYTCTTDRDSYESDYSTQTD